MSKIIPVLEEIEIENFIENLPISNIRATFYKTILKERKEKILDKALEINKNIENDIEHGHGTPIPKKKKENGRGMER